MDLGQTRPALRRDVAPLGDKTHNPRGEGTYVLPEKCDVARSDVVGGGQVHPDVADVMVLALCRAWPSSQPTQATSWLVPGGTLGDSGPPGRRTISLMSSERISCAACTLTPPSWAPWAN